MRLLRTLLVMLAAAAGPAGSGARAQTEVPVFERDPAWPQPLPDDWRLGIVWGVAVDPRDHVWVLHAADNYRDEIEDEGKTPAPPVIEFDPEGNVVRAWGGRDQGHPWFYRMDSPRLARVDERPHPVREHALNVDHRGDVWISGGGHLVLKFSPDGEFLLQDRRAGQNRRQRPHPLPRQPVERRLRSAHQRGVRRGRLPQQAGGGVRHGQRGVQAALGPLRPAAGRCVRGRPAARVVGVPRTDRFLPPLRPRRQRRRRRAGCTWRTAPTT